jgi:hypothetical protein
VLSGVAFAGYSLKKGDAPVCDAYWKVLEESSSFDPMACERHYNSVPGFAPLPWRELNFQKYFGLYQEAAIYLDTNGNSQESSLSQRDAEAMTQHLRSAAEYLTEQAGKQCVVGQAA